MIVKSESLSKMLEQSEHVHQLLEQSADELCSIEAENGLLDQVTFRLRDASQRLTAVNQALLAEIRNQAMIDHQFAAAVEQKESARNAALHDDLTGLPNRALFRDRLEHGIAQAIRHRWSLAVMFIDLDGFKEINDRYGHQTGDAVLQSVAVRLEHNTRNEDTVSRYGGDEFLYLLSPIHDQKDIAMIASKILRAIQAPCEVRAGDEIVNLDLAASLGISVFPKDGVTPSVLINRADDAMYAAKESKTGFGFA